MVLRQTGQQTGRQMGRQVVWRRVRASVAWLVLASVGLWGMGLGQTPWGAGQAQAEVPPAATWPLASSQKATALQANGKLTADKHTYLRVPLPEAARAGLPGMYMDGMVRVVVHGKVHGVGALSADHEALLLRLASADPPADGLEVTLLSTDRYTHLERKAGQVRRLVINGAKAAPAVKDLAGDFWRALASAMQAHAAHSFSARTPFLTFAYARLNAIADGKPPPVQPIGPQSANRDAMMSLLTGATSIDETLQVDRALRVRAQPASARTILLAEVTPLPAPVHPWAKMIVELPTKPALEPLASAVPEEMIYAHFHDLRSLLKLGGDLERRAPLLDLIMGSTGADAHVIARYEHQLVLERLGLAEKVGHLATSGVAIAVGDPFVRDGTDVSLLFKVTNRAMLVTALDLYEANARAKRPDLTITTYTLNGVEVRRLSTPDRFHDQHRAELGDLLILSNSQAALAKLIATHQGRAKPLSDALDFQYMRALYPFNTADEDGFVFISDAAIAHATSPAVRIAQARRMEAKADMQAIAFAALLYGWLEGKPIERAEELVKLGIMAPEELQHPDGAPITFDPTHGPSSAWGRLSMLTPLSELTITHVTPDERDAYDAFREDYQHYWSKFIDPIAARIRRLDDGKTLAIDLRILPLIENSEYNELVKLTGGTFFSWGPAAPSGAVEFATTLDRGGELLRQLDHETGRALSIKVSDWIGEWFVAGLAEKSDMWQAMRALRDFPMTGPRLTTSDDHEALNRLRETSFFFALHLKDPVLATKFLWEVDKLSSAEGFTGEITLTDYRRVQIARVPLTRNFGDFGSDLGYFVIVKDVMLYSFNEATIKQQIDRVLDGGFPTVSPAPKPPYAANGPGQVGLRAGWPSADGDLPKLALDVLEYQALDGCTQASVTFEALARGLTFLPSDPDILRQRSLAYLGAEPACAHGGAFSFDPYQVVNHSHYGSFVAPSPYTVPVKGSPVTEAVALLRDITTQISFEGAGDHHSLHVQLRWQTR
jgi:hypothetical protein